ncbi:hypothetical protein E3P92_01451 [Wallemia ichthyophaga]|uniref:Type 1 phosphatases regulator n=1 Tax=Wallemia ichthyophaga TaxID=245174 RepID=A0A4T0JW39_WALIC|nr:hypothetical protein E3P91_01154 [Wallemia ichthyophaga]TIA82573.1 hypothetical protein E3P98_01294 [Wallemia ichthyophaga]TIA92455.1 hypothetical protein E3P97_01460 [Wallemia ichthyophaga]TIA99365.1 hypothetical protein E3P96_02926 [Wallemia ichthyophaga]TIB01464.1 hypothetical protein E3P95_01296 [Wallemia ichthyophaga]
METERSQTGQGSETVEGTESRTQPQQHQSQVLKLRGDEPKQREQRERGGGVRWEQGTVDNEHMGKKKSKICCIYHKPKRFDESSDESDCSDNEHRHASNCNLNKYDNPSHTSHRHGASKDKDTA